MSTPTTTTSATPGPTTSSSSSGSSGGPTSSPLLFFVALGFGVVFTNLWIIVGVKYCFRYNQRNRAARALNENGEPIDLAQMPNPRRRRREKKLMSMEDVNERFPLTKYKIWRSTREAEGLPAAGGVTAPPSRAASIRDEERTIDSSMAKQSTESARPQTALSMAREDRANAISYAPRISLEVKAAASTEEIPEKGAIERTETAETTETTDAARATNDRYKSTVSDVDEDDDDPIRTAAPPELLAVPGDTCAICLDNLDDDDDVRGLTCGHAFHGSCVDPWLTSRRACCPLCKADYYVPKPRADGDDVTGAGRHRGHTMPQQPTAAWVGLRGMPTRTRFMFAPRFFVTDDNQHVYPSIPAEEERRRREQNISYQEASTERAQQTNNRTWRSRLPTMPQFGRRDPQSNNPHGPIEETWNSPSELEAGVRR